MRKNRNKATVPASNLESNFGHAPLGAKKAKGLDTQCRLHVHSRRWKLADADGISAKAAIDGIVMAGLLRDDSPAYLSEVSYSQEKIPHSRDEETIITIEVCHDKEHGNGEKIDM